MIKVICKKENYYSLIIAVVLLLISFFTQKYFSEGITSYTGFVSSKILYFILSFFIVHFLISFFKNLKLPFYKEWAINLLLVAIPLLVWLLLSWPGIFTWDEFWVYEAATKFSIENWQSYLTSYFYIINLYFFPSVATIVFFQITFMSFVVSWFLTHIKFKFQTGKLFKILIIVFLSLWPSIIFSTLITFRSTMLAILELWLIGYIYFSIDKEKLNNKNLILLALMTILLSTWRAEGIYHLILVPLCLFIVCNKQNIKKLLLFSFAILIGVLALNRGYDLIKQDNYGKMKYELTAYMNPISNIMADKNVNVSKLNMDALNKVIDIEKTKEDAYMYETPSFWNGAVREGFSEQDFKNFKKEYIKLVALNPDIFIGARTRTLVAASGLSPNAYLVSDYINDYIKTKPNNEAAELMLKSEFNYPLNISLRQVVIDYLNTSKSQIGYVNMAIIFWDFLPIILFLFVILFRVRSIKDPFLWISLLCLGRIPILFIAEPGSYFMYYYPMYLSGIFTVIIFILDKRNKLKESNPTLNMKMIRKGI